MVQMKNSCLDWEILFAGSERQFAQMTGLSFRPATEDTRPIEQRDQSSLFGTKDPVTGVVDMHDSAFVRDINQICISRLETVMTETTNPEIAYKLGLIYFIDVVLRGRENSTKVSRFLFFLVDDMPRFMSYPWGQYFWDITRMTLLCQRDALANPKGKKDKKKKNDISCMLIAFYVRCYETLPQCVVLKYRFATKVNEDSIPRMLRWQPRVGRIHMKLVEEFLKNTGLVVVRSFCENDTEKDMLRESGLIEEEIISTPPIYPFLIEAPPRPWSTEHDIHDDHFENYVHPVPDRPSHPTPRDHAHRDSVHPSEAGPSSSSEPVPTDMNSYIVLMDSRLEKMQDKFDVGQSKRDGELGGRLSGQDEYVNRQIIHLQDMITALRAEFIREFIDLKQLFVDTPGEFQRGLNMLSAHCNLGQMYQFNIPIITSQGHAQSSMPPPPPPPIPTPLAPLQPQHTFPDDQLMVNVNDDFQFETTENESRIASEDVRGRMGFGFDESYLIIEEADSTIVNVDTGLGKRSGDSLEDNNDDALNAQRAKKFKVIRRPTNE